VDPGNQLVEPEELSRPQLEEQALLKTIITEGRKDEKSARRLRGFSARTRRGKMIRCRKRDWKRGGREGSKKIKRKKAMEIA